MCIRDRRRSMTAERMSAVGFASFSPACFGALPWTASKMAQSLPILALGARPVSYTHLVSDMIK